MVLLKGNCLNIFDKLLLITWKLISSYMYENYYAKSHVIYCSTMCHNKWPMRFTNSILTCFNYVIKYLDYFENKN